MEPRHKIVSSINFGKTLVERGVSGAREGAQEYLKDHSLRSIMFQVARESVMLAAIGATASVLPVYLASQRKRPKNSLAYAISGLGLILLSGFAWGTRDIAGVMTCSARKQLHAARDEHWLQQNPVDYA
jgi:hypothetical protein